MDSQKGIMDSQKKYGSAGIRKKNNRGFRKQTKDSQKLIMESQKSILDSQKKTLQTEAYGFAKEISRIRKKNILDSQKKYSGFAQKN